MTTAEQGKSVTISYSITLEDGTKIDQKKSKPLTFKMGARRVIPALEQGVTGMQLHEVRKVPITADQGYGQYKEDLVLKVKKDMFTSDVKLVPGRTLQYQTRDGERANFVVREVDEESVTIDGNHPLAGQNLLYEVELLAVR